MHVNSRGEWGLSSKLSPNLLQQDKAPCTKQSSERYGLLKIDVEELQWPAQSPDLNPTKNLQDELQHKLRTKPFCHDLTNALVPEREIPRSTFQNHPKRVETVTAAKKKPTLKWVA